MAEKVNFTINLDGNLYTGLADIDKELKTVTASATSTLKIFDRINSTAFKFNNITDFIGKVSSTLGSIAAPAMEAETQLQNLKTLYRGNADAAKDMYDRIAQTSTDLSGLGFS